MLPSKYNTDIETSGGDITLYNLIGENNLNTSGGDVKVMSTTGELMVETSGGDITIDQHKGNSRLSTSGGDINTLKLVGNLKATTSGGDVRVEVSDGSILAKTSGGDIDISYYGNNKGIEARTSGGVYMQEFLHHSKQMYFWKQAAAILKAIFQIRERVKFPEVLLKRNIITAANL
jgi:DUF4097 and DUF4098 domain-containing protein YvlB